MAKSNFQQRNFKQRDFLPGNWTGVGTFIVPDLGLVSVSDREVNVVTCGSQQVGAVAPWHQQVNYVLADDWAATTLIPSDAEV